MRNLALLVTILACLFRVDQLGADNVDIPGLDDYPLRIVSLRVGESLTLKAIAEVTDSSTVPVDVMVLIDDSVSMSGTINSLAAEWYGDLGDVFSRWDTRVGIYKYHVNGSALVEPLGPASESVFETQVLIGYVWVGNTRVGLYEPIYESQGDGSPSYGISALRRVMEEQAWRERSVRVIFALMDSHFKEGPSPLDTAALVEGYLGTGLFVFSGLIGPGPCCGGTDPEFFSTKSGGTIQSMPLNSFVTEMPEALAANLPFGFNQVSIMDDGASAEGVGLDVLCTSSAAGGECDADSADGSFLRDGSNSFEFDITFDALKVGVWPVKLELVIDGKVTREFLMAVNVDPASLILRDGFEGRARK